jgi:hypothetical protein
MQFSASRPDVVRAINQRWLLKRWKEQLGNNRIPQWKAVGTEELTRIASNLSILEVSGGDGTARFRVRFHGETIGRVYGSADCSGKYLDEIIPPERQKEGLAPYHQVLESSQPVYTVHDVTDRNGRLVHYERLLLPYAHSGASVDHILASLEFICPDGAYDSLELMTLPSAPPKLRLSATIGPRLPI